MEAIEQIDTLYDSLQDHLYLIITGGTGDAWIEQISDIFKNMEGLTTLLTNHYDSFLPNVYSNMQGYYYIRRLQLRRKR